MMRDPIPVEAQPHVATGSDAWRYALPAIAVSLLWIFAWYWSTGKSMVEIWARSDTFAHGFVVAPIALWLIWRARARLAAITPRPSGLALVLLAVAGFGWLLGELGSANVIAQLGFVTLIVLAVPAVLGIAVARALAFPLAFLFFAVPNGEFLLPQLMEWTAQVTVLALKVTGIPVYREGLRFVIPSGSWSVVEACSGVRYLIASTMVGTLFAYLNYRSLRRRVIFVGFSILVPIAANWVRAYMIVMIGHVSGNKLAAGVDHLVYGWLFFGLVMVIMFWIGARWREDDKKPPGQERLFAVRQGPQRASRIWTAAATLAAVVVAWPMAYAAIERSDAASPPSLAVLGDINEWRATPGTLTDWRPNFQNPSAEVHQTFSRHSDVVGLYIAYYRNQDKARKLVSSDNALVRSDDPKWARVANGMQTVQIDGDQVRVYTAELRGVGGDRLVAWQSYWIDGRFTASDHLAKGYAALSRLMGRGDDSAVIIVYAQRDRSGEVSHALDAFLQDAVPIIETALASTRDRR